ncbi:MAG: phospholipase D-like domain-containing protein [Silvanigrellaceae bacterium]
MSLSVARNQPPQMFKSKGGWEAEELLIDGDSYFAKVIEAIDTAKHRVYLESYIFEYDSLGRKLMGSLFAAQARGVEIKILIDGVGSANLIGSMLRPLREQGLEIRVHHPLPWQIIPSISMTRGFGLPSLLRIFSYANSRNHRKMVLVDGHIAFVGSLNVAEVHLAEVMGEHAWHDLGVRVEGELCQLLERMFLKAWGKSWRAGKHGILSPLLTLSRFVGKSSSEWIVRNDGRSMRHASFQQRLRAIRNAQKRIWIANAYFVPSGALLRGLMAAAKRGVDVRILLPRISDVHFMPWISRAFYETLIKFGVKVYEFTPRVLHAKAMLLDEKCWIGSSNLNHRSLLHDYELDVILSDDRVLGSLEQSFARDFLNSHQVDKLSLAGQPFVQRLLVGILLYFRHML